MPNNVRIFQSLKKETFNDEENPSRTSEEQMKVELSVESLYSLFAIRAEVDLVAPTLLRQKHLTFLSNSLTHLPAMYQCLDASRPWLCYWILHSLALLDEHRMLLPEDVSRIVEFLNRCQCPTGGFGGGPGQEAHLAPTYAAVNALCILGTKEALDVINREALLKFLWSVRSADGAFHMHEGGEEDIRGVYCAVEVAKLTNIHSEALFKDTADWVIRCQTYEGGFGGTPDMEAHGGYAFCGIAALSLLGKEHFFDLKKLLRWSANRQMRYEGGFQGRTNKLVDGCYSFWQGGVFPIIQKILSAEGDLSVLSADRWLFNQEALQEYILICCQSSSGGLVDKPTKPRDIYHTCYTLSGLSVAQHAQLGPTHLVGNPENELTPVHPIYNITYESVVNTFLHFKHHPVPNVVPS